MSTQLRRTGALTTSAFAVLGLLAIGARSAYELTREMNRTLRFFWPRAESKLYEAPKALEALGLTRSSRSFVGQRPRTDYEITAAGREELRRWLATRGIAELELESEALVRTWFGHLGTIEDLRAAIRDLQAQAERNLDWGRDVAESYLRDGLPPERGHLGVLIFRFLWDFNQMLEGWAAWSLREVATWDDVQLSDERLQRARDILDEALRDHRAGRPERD